jgi:TRAP-type C4-dicarboxylate transport system permease small subunit
MAMKDNLLVSLFTIICLIAFGFTYYTLIDAKGAEIEKINQQFWYLMIISTGVIVLIILVLWASRKF